MDTKRGIMNRLVLIFMLFGVSNLVLSSTKNAYHLPIKYCYHWLSESSKKYLTHKYNYSKKNKGELTFYTTSASSNGAVAGPGLYLSLIHI